MVMTRAQRARAAAKAECAAQLAAAAGKGGSAYAVSHAADDTPCVGVEGDVAAAIIADLHTATPDDDVDLSAASCSVNTSDATSCQPDSDMTDYEVDVVLIKALQRDDGVPISSAVFTRILELEMDAELPQAVLSAMSAAMCSGDNAQVLAVAQCLRAMSAPRVDGGERQDHDRRKTLAYRMTSAGLPLACVNHVKHNHDMDVSVAVIQALVPMATWYPSDTLRCAGVLDAVICGMATLPRDSELLTAVLALAQALLRSTSDVPPTKAVVMMEHLKDLALCLFVHTAHSALVCLDTFATHPETAALALHTPAVFLVMLEIVYCRQPELCSAAMSVLMHLVSHMNDNALAAFVQNDGVGIVAQTAGGGVHHGARLRALQIMGYIIRRPAHTDHVLLNMRLCMVQMSTAICAGECDHFLVYACMHLLWSATPYIVHDERHATLRLLLSGKTYAAVRAHARGSGSIGKLAQGVVRAVGSRVK